jgi:anti-sigma B factor antagonist
MPGGGRYRVEIIRGVPVVTAPEEIDISNAEDLGEVLLSSADDGYATIVLDMSATRFCDSAGCKIMVRVQNRALAEDGALRLVMKGHDPVARALDITGISRFIPVFRTVEEAVGTGSGIPADQLAARRPPVSRPHPSARPSGPGGVSGWLRSRSGFRGRAGA